MELDIQVALVTAAGMILAALVGAVGISTVLNLRANVRLLCKEVENYHSLEGHLIREILKFEGREITETLVMSRRGDKRSEYSNRDDDRVEMKLGELKRIKRRALIL